MTPNEIKKAAEALCAFISENFASKKDFADTLGMSQPSISHWTTGRHPMPLHVVNRLVYLLGDRVPRGKLRPDLFKC